MERNAIASTISHATITSEATAPAVILAFSFSVVDDPCRMILVSEFLALISRLAGFPVQ
jgi:hypothetical protein